jgi:chemotaxis protein CheZ
MNALQAADAAGAGRAQEELLTRVGQMTRSLHDSLRGLGFDKLIARAAHDIPDARDRLDYVARMTEQAAQRVLNATEAASPLQEDIGAGAASLAQAWRAVEDAALPAACSELAGRTVAFLERAGAASDATRQHLLDIMMAQDFQDLTGQVIRKVTELAHGLEQQLVQLLVDYAPAEMRREAADDGDGDGLLNGPQIKPEGNPDVVAGQEQVDDLLDSLGF